MNRWMAGVIGLILLSFQIASSDVAPVKYLAGKTEVGQPHLYWFGAAAVESTLYYDNDSSFFGVFIAEQWFDNQAQVRFSCSLKPYVVTELSAYIEPPEVIDTASRFALAVRAGDTTRSFTPFLSWLNTSVRWESQNARWVSVFPNVLLQDTTFRASLHWMADSPKDPKLGHQRISPSSGNSFVGWAPSGPFELYPFADGNLMIRAKVLFNDFSLEHADSFWVYRLNQSADPVHIATAGPEQFDYIDSPPSSDNYYYQVSRWEGNQESPRSNLIGLSASPTAVEDRPIEKHAFLLSEPFPNPTSAGVIFTARTDKQMPLGYSIYNLLGQKVFSKPSAGYPAGEHQFLWNGQDASGRRLSSGLYLLRFQAGEEVLVKKITLLR